MVTILPMRKHFLFALLLVSVGLKAQQLPVFQVEPAWKGLTPVADDRQGSRLVPTFEGAALDERGLPLWTRVIESPDPTRRYTLRLVSGNWEPVPREWSARLGREQTVSEAPSGWMQGKCMLRLQFSPLRRTAGGTWERLVSGRLRLEDLGPETERPLGSNAKKTTANSRLATGTWHKISVSKTGVFRITPSLLSDLGLDPGTVSPAHVRIFGNGGRMLPERVETPRPDDLVENPAKRVHNGDQKFDAGEYVLFYAQGPHGWSFDGTNGKFTHEFNVYSETSYYFLTVDQGAGPEIPNWSEPVLPSTATVTSFTDYDFIEQDKENIVGTGREWYGDLFDFTLSYNYSFTFPHLLLTEPVEVRLAGAARSSTAGTALVLSTGTVPVLSVTFPAVSTASGASYMERNSGSATYTASSTALSYTVTYNQGGNPAAVAWLNHLEVQVKRSLNMSGLTELHFRQTEHLGAGQVVEYRLANPPAGTEIWEVTNPLDPKKVTTAVQGTELVFTAAADSLREFVALAGSGFAVPTARGAVANQNLHATASQHMVIVTTPSLMPAAERLAEHHRTFDGMNVFVTTTDLIYNEFSSGRQDPAAIRDFMRFLYDNATGPQDRPRYLLLFGDASYDYKDRLSGNSNLVPTWESMESSSLNSSICTDDFFAYLDPGEGYTSGNVFPGYQDLGVGRFPVRTLGEANQAVDKVIRYTTDPSAMGSWRNRMLFVSDDVDASWELQLFDRAELSAEVSKTRNPNINVDKVFADAYSQEITAGTQRYPAVRDDIFRKVQSGVLAVCYVGHGGEIGWASERILQNTDIKAWTNNYGMPLITTITCEFARFDDPKRVSAGELAFLNSGGGAIALLSTQRTVFAFDNTLNLSVEIYDTLCALEQGQSLTLGQLTQYVKNGNSSNDRNRFSLLGDPAMRLTFPKHLVITDSINGVAVMNPLDTLKALAFVTVNGHLEDHSGNMLSGFNGLVNPVIFDKSVTKTTQVNDGAGSPRNFQLQTNVIYKGNATVEDGRFQFSFIVPLDIAYNYGNGRISYYALNGTEDAAGYFDQFYVGGFNNQAAADNQGPEVDLYMNDTRFVPGGITDENPSLLALVRDSSGINTVGNGVGHDLVAILDENSEQSYVLNDYYEADTNSYQSGRIRYPFFKLSSGRHTLSLRVWDVYNNPSLSETQFVVAESAELALEHVLNYPNPFTTNTEFHFEHNRANQPLDVQVQVFTVNGKLVKTINRQMIPEGNRVTGISWDGRDDYGDLIGKGVYVYRLRIRSVLEKDEAEVYEKLVILR